MPDAAYYRAWRAAHPEYRARELANSRERKRRLRATRLRPRAARAVRSAQPLVDASAVNRLDLGHPLYERAVAIVGGLRKPDGGTFVFAHELIRTEAIQVAVLAMLERRNARTAVEAFRGREVGWLARTRTLNAAADESFVAEVAA